MTVEQMIVQRTTELTAIKAASNAAVAAKGGTPADNLSGLPAAIERIPSGGDLPELKTPAEVGHVVAGKEYIDAGGNKQTGTLVVCDSIEEVETTGEAGVGLNVEIESPVDGSAVELKIPEQNLLPENIKNGVRIFGIAGSAKTLRVETGTITPAEDSTILELPCTANPKMFIVSATDAAMESIVSGATNSALTSVGTNTAIKTGSVGSLSAAYTSVITVFTASSAKIQRTIRDVDIDPVVSIASADGYPWRAGVEYQWTAYYWGDDT